MTRSFNKRISGYLFAIVVSGATFAIKSSLVKNIHWPENSFILGTLAVIISAWYGGLGPGILATTINYFINDYFFITPGVLLIKNAVVENTRIVLFLIEGLSVSWLFELLHRSQRRVQELDEKKSEFLSIVSHELRTPISIIKIISESLIRNSRKQKLPGSIANQLRDITSEVNQVEDLIKDLLDIQKIENSSFVLYKEQANIYPLIKSVIEKMKNIKGNKNISWANQIRKRSMNVSIDKFRIEQVLTNLIANAIQNSPKGSQIKVTSEVDRKKLIISVSDKGIGIPKSKQTKIFEKYYQVERKRRGGFGLGLFISKQIVQKHGGEIWVNSTGGRGSTFYFSLPIS